MIPSIHIVLLLIYTTIIVIIIMAERRSATMSKITNDGLTWCGTGC